MEKYTTPSYLQIPADQDLTSASFTKDVINSIKTIEDMIRWVYSYFQDSNIHYGHGYLDASQEANEIVYAALSINCINENKPLHCRLTEIEKIYILNWVYARVHQHIPLAYLTHHIYYYGNNYYVDQRTIIPRSPIGELIDNQFRGLLDVYPRYILDMCTGSGVLALYAAQKFSEAQVDGVDISTDALDVAYINLTSYPELSERVAFIQSDLFTNIPKECKYSLIISNPPYVDFEDFELMPQEYCHEPRLSLLAGDDGLDLLRRLLLEVGDYLDNDGVFICEVGNSMLALQQKLGFDLQWLELENGGIGVFKITKSQLVEHRHLIEAFAQKPSPDIKS